MSTHPSSTFLNGPIDKRLSHVPFTDESRVRFPLGLQIFIIMITTIAIASLAGFGLGCICTLLAFDCPKCKCECNDNKKQLLKG